MLENGAVLGGTYSACMAYLWEYQYRYTLLSILPRRHRPFFSSNAAWTQQNLVVMIEQREEEQVVAK